MKKILFTLMAAALCLTACDEDYTDWKAPQSIELGQVAAELPEGYVTDSTALDVVNADGTTTPLALTDNTVQVSDLADIITKAFGRRPEFRTLQVKASVYAWTSDKKTDRICATKTFEVKVKPVAPAIEDAYYYIGALGSDKSHPMTKEADGVFTVPAVGGWHWFKIAPESGFGADGNFDWANEGNCLCATSKDNESTEGKFVIGGDKYSWHLIEPEGATSFTITVDLYDMNYSITAKY